MNLLETFDSLLANWQAVFSQQRMFERALRLSFGLLSCLRLHLTSTAICASGRQFVDWSADYRLCSRSPWEPYRLFDPVFDHLPSLLVSPTTPVIAALPLQLVVIKPLGYRLRKGSKLLYRQPAFLICTDLELSLQALVQSYLYRWEIECNHRDEKILAGRRSRPWNPHAVRRLRQLQVAGYSLLLLASLLSSGFQRTAEYLPLPKWRRKSIRPSLLDLLALLRDQIFAGASETPPLLNFDDFKTAPPALAKSSKQPLASDTLCTFAA